MVWMGVRWALPLWVWHRSVFHLDFTLFDHWAKNHLRMKETDSAKKKEKRKKRTPNVSPCFGFVQVIFTFTLIHITVIYPTNFFWHAGFYCVFSTTFLYVCLECWKDLAVIHWLCYRINFHVFCLIKARLTTETTASIQQIDRKQGNLQNGNIIII